MIINQKRIRKIEAHLGHIPIGTELILAAPMPDADKMQTYGFVSCRSGETVLPKASRGPASRFNSEGRFIIHRDQPKERFSWFVDAEWMEWHGDQQVPQFGTREFQGWRYPRTFVPPPGCEIRVTENFAGAMMITSGRYAYTEENKSILRHNINVMLEVFGLCEILTSDLQSLILTHHQRVNWTILPHGPMVWERLKHLLCPIVQHRPEGTRRVIEKRLELLNELGAEQVITGREGFLGYVVFSFPRKGFFVFESTKHDNATYIFGSDWEALSKMTKAEVIQGSHFIHRIIHSMEWDARIRTLLLDDRRVA